MGISKTKPCCSLLHFSPLLLLFLLRHSCHILCYNNSSYGCSDEVLKRSSSSAGRAESKGMFVFGSSLVDNGNNNFATESSVRADYLPYGIDFPLGPSGRFSNGNNMVDVLGKLLKLSSPMIPVFEDPLTRGKKIVHGVNYASAGSGILDDTGSVSGCVISLNQQIRNFEKVTLPDIEAQLGCKSTELLSDYLFVLGTGGNDYLLNFFLSNASLSLPVQAFTAILTATLSTQIKKLYNLGARKFILISIYPMGYTPVVKAICSSAREGCRDIINQAALLFNSHLKSLVDNIKPEMPASNLVYINTYQVITDIIDDPTSKGFSDASNPCCEVSSLNEGGNGIMCKRKGSTCWNRNSHVFFDGLHPTEAVNTLVMEIAYASNLTTEVYPFNVKQLAML